MYRRLLLVSRTPNPLPPSTLLRRCFVIVRQEQELYISQLEGQDKVPEGKEVVHPVPGFVIKTKFTKGSRDVVPEKVTHAAP